MARPPARAQTPRYGGGGGRPRCVVGSSDSSTILFPKSEPIRTMGTAAAAGAAAAEAAAEGWLRGRWVGAIESGTLEIVGKEPARRE